MVAFVEQYVLGPHGSLSVISSFSIPVVVDQPGGTVRVMVTRPL